MARDIHNIKEVVALVIASVDAVKEAKADGKIGLEDLALLMKLLPVVGPAVDGAGDIPAELSDLSAEEVAEVAAYIMSSHALGDSEKAKALISGALQIVAGAVTIIQGLKAPQA